MFNVGNHSDCLKAQGHQRTPENVMPVCPTQAHRGMQLCNHDSAQVNMHALVTALCKNVDVR